jgi:hypothetical protein
VLRRSIEDLCGTDHGGGPAILGPWLANKTPENVTARINANPTGVIVGVGSIASSSEIRLNYVAPWVHLQRVSKALLHAMENHPSELGTTACTLISTQTAHRLYQGCGYKNSGPQVSSHGGTLAFPMRGHPRRRAAPAAGAPFRYVISAEPRGGVSRQRLALSRPASRAAVSLA